MKKYFVLLFLFFLGTIRVNAYEIGDYYIDQIVLTNGDILVREMFVLKGEFNGYERKLLFANSQAPAFDGEINSFRGSDIYNATGIEVISIKYMDLANINGFSDFNNDGVRAKLVTTAVAGDFGKYEENHYSTGVNIRMYNPSADGYGAFFMEYLIKDVAILHNDIAEIGWNIFSDQQDESIANLVIRINLPQNEDEARIWGHGPLFGKTSIENKQTMLFTVEGLDANTAIDMRIVFDKDVINASSKKTDVNALAYILEIEEELADEANRLRDEAKAAEAWKLYLGYVMDGIKVGWFILLAKKLNEVRKYSKPYETVFKTKYFRDFPNDYNPTTVSYLLNKKIEKKDISASILDLVQRKVINYEKTTKKDYIFKLAKKDAKLSASEERLIKFLFVEIGKDDQFTIKEINTYAKKKSADFLRKYDEWVTLATKEAKDYNFFYEKTKEETAAIVLAVLGIILIFISYALGQILTSTIALLVAISAIIYVSSITKRTKGANESFARWLGLKNFLNDFGNFKERELPHIELWEKYLVYATVFGNAKKLAKQMAIKFNEIPNNQSFTNDMVRLQTFNALNVALGTGLNTSVSTAHRITSSTASSGGGFGGGFSGGGGSFGGGGGGGRF